MSNALFNLCVNTTSIKLCELVTGDLRHQYRISPGKSQTPSCANAPAAGSAWLSAQAKAAVSALSRGLGGGGGFINKTMLIGWGNKVSKFSRLFFARVCVQGITDFRGSFGKSAKFAKILLHGVLVRIKHTL